MKSSLYLILGLICLILGIIGIFIPVLPVTPFLLLSAWAFARSSKKLYDWLLEHPVLGIYVKSYIKYRAISINAKISGIVALWLSIGFSIYIVKITWVRILLLVIAAGVTTHLTMLKTLSKQEMQEKEEMERQALLLARKKKEASKGLLHR
ncbi:MAG: YbaN family protein [Eubacteriales bacterium]|nr:YbaN family protein [Eubacteriales bacterium]